MRTDAEIEQYLETVNSYAEAKEAASQAWKDAFLHLTRARISHSALGSSMYDPSLPAAVTAQIRANGTVALSVANSRDHLTAMGGAWPPEAVRQAQKAFTEAIRHEHEARSYYVQLN